MKQKRKLGSFIKFMILSFVAAIILLPVLWMFFSSFRAAKEIISWPPKFLPHEWVFDNYRKVFKRAPMMTYIKNSAIFAVSTTCLSCMINSFAGYAFARLHFRGKNVLFTMCLMTMMIPFQVTMIPLFTMINKMGIYDTWAGLILPRMAGVMGIFMMRAFFVGLPLELEEAGRIDGLTDYGIFARIMLPLAKPALVTQIVLGLNGAWNDLLYPLLMTSNVRMRMLSNGVALFVGQDTTDYGPAFAAGVVSMLPMLLLYLFGQRYFVEGTATSGLKG